MGHCGSIASAPTEWKRGETGNFSGVSAARFVSVIWFTIAAWLTEVAMAMEWTITIEGRNEFGEFVGGRVRIDKNWERVRDGRPGCRSTMARRSWPPCRAQSLTKRPKLTHSFDGSARIATTFGQSRTIRRAEFERCSARWRFAIPAGCCVGIATQAWTLRSRRSRKSARIGQHPS